MAALAGATEVKLEGRVVPVVRSRAEGISQAHSLGEKVRRWADVTAVDIEGLLARLEHMETADVDQIVQKILSVDVDATRADQESTAQNDLRDDIPPTGTLTE
jgi:hypothetical protein